MTRNKFFTLLGFAQKSGNTIMGDDLVEAALNKRSISLIIISSDASESTKAKYIKLCESLNIKIIIDFSREDLSYAIGKFNRTLIGIRNKKFSRELFSIYEDIKSGPE